MSGKTCGTCTYFQRVKDEESGRVYSECDAPTPICVLETTTKLRTDTDAARCVGWSDGTPSLGDQAIDLLRKWAESEVTEAEERARDACIYFARNLPPRKP